MGLVLCGLGCFRCSWVCVCVCVTVSWQFQRSSCRLQCFLPANLANRSCLWPLMTPPFSPTTGRTDRSLQDCWWLMPQNCQEPVMSQWATSQNWSAALGSCKCVSSRTASSNLCSSGVGVCVCLTLWKMKCACCRRIGNLKCDRSRWKWWVLHRPPMVFINVLFQMAQQLQH